jgi:hypothetical protein
LKIGVPDSTGEVGFALSLTMRESGDVGERVSGLEGVPTTQQVSAAPGGQVPAVPSACPAKKPPKATVESNALPRSLAER